MNELGRHNSLYKSLPIQNQYGQYQVGGPIGFRDINAAAQIDPILTGGAELAADVAPISGTIRDVERLPEQYQAYQQAENPIQQALRAADMAMTGGALVADVLPGLKAAGVGGAALISLMARRNDELTGIARALRNQQGIIGYHGSPHKFSKFDHSMMGSGEGAQAYGWGTYLAENPAIGKTYADDLAYGIEIPGVNPAVNRQIARDFAGSDFTSVDEIPDEWFQEIANDFRLGGMEDAARSLEAADKSKVRAVTGNLYEVDLPDEQIAKMLDWDAPLSEQPESVIKALKQDPRLARFYDEGKIDDMYQNGGEFYRALTSRHAQDAPLHLSVEAGENMSQQGASEALNELGIPGIKYWDGGSRSAGEGTRNYVVFDEDLMTILKRNDEALDLPMGEASRIDPDIKNRIDFFNTPEGEGHRLPNLVKSGTIPESYLPPQAKQKTVKIYRAVRDDIKDASIREGDWVSLNADYAALHGTGPTGKSKIISMEVPAKDIGWAGTDMNEYFYVPQN